MRRNYLFMRNLLLLILLGISSKTCLHSQQEQLYTQFMFNKLALNPAYAGNEKVTCVSLLLRDQWHGLQGAPKTQLISLNAPLMSQKIGIGVNIARNTIGISQRQTLDFIYAYRIQLSSGTFSLGGQGSVRRFDIDFTDDRLVAIQPLSADPSVDVTRLSKSLINFGLGFYYSTNSYFLGASIPRLRKGDIDFDETDNSFSLEARHVYLMAGGAWALNNRWTFRPQALVRVVENSPFDFDLNFGFQLDEKYHVATSFRAGGNDGSLIESLDFIFGLQLNEQLMVGFAYDITLSDIREYQDGSFELTMGYCFNKTKNAEEVINPRYF